MFGWLKHKLMQRRARRRMEELFAALGEDGTERQREAVAAINDFTHFNVRNHELGTILYPADADPNRPFLSPYYMFPSEESDAFTIPRPPGVRIPDRVIYGEPVRIPLPLAPEPTLISYNLETGQRQ